VDLSLFSTILFLFFFSLPHFPKVFFFFGSRSIFLRNKYDVSQIHPPGGLSHCSTPLLPFVFPFSPVAPCFLVLITSISLDPSMGHNAPPLPTFVFTKSSPFFSIYSPPPPQLPCFCRYFFLFVPPAPFDPCYILGPQYSPRRTRSFILSPL